ncbi:MAG: uncharacterized protein KVP18_005176 [Porospora cf. gigantea A]|uniref:uncharacterized protein n=1 Tax=Porospora cf. gigantea A TaxID=2853593 RepID=UPI00355A72EB|nr:MAG: hypothetical protein KVP18_005176 [Porospora cf. gigantea A]
MFAVSLCRLLRQGSGIALASGYQAFRARASETILKLPSLMSPTEAEKILDLASYSKRDINEKAERLMALCTPGPDYAGSPYIVRKVKAAQRVLLRTL